MPKPKEEEADEVLLHFFFFIFSSLTLPRLCGLRGHALIFIIVRREAHVLPPLLLLRNEKEEMKEV